MRTTNFVYCNLQCVHCREINPFQNLEEEICPHIGIGVPKAAALEHPPNFDVLKVTIEAIEIEYI